MRFRAVTATKRIAVGEHAAEICTGKTAKEPRIKGS